MQRFDRPKPRICVCLALYLLLNAEALPAADAASADTPGLQLRVESIGTAAKDCRTARLAALYVPADTPPTPFVPAGPFRAVFEADLNLRLRDDVSFSVAARGAVKLMVNGEMILEKTPDDLAGATTRSVRLKKGKNHLNLEYTSPSKGDAFVRLYWASSEFPPEPIPPTMFTHGSTEPLTAATRLRQGRDLLATRRCLNCHAADLATERGYAPIYAPKDLAHLVMPELHADAPSLETAGSRLNETWIVRWILDPRSLRPDASMPRVLRDDAARQAKDIAAYLASLHDAVEPMATEPTPELTAAGARLFAHLNCIGCHTLPDAAGFDTENQRIPLAYLKAKYKPGALRAYLKSPEKSYAWTRMPNFRLSDVEADRLTAFLLSRATKTIEPANDAANGNAVKGRQLVQSVGCLNCHDLGKNSALTLPSPGVPGESVLKSPQLSAIDVSKFTVGCLATKIESRRGAPDFGLTDSDRAAIGAFLSTDRSSLKSDTLPEFEERQIRSLRCTACHVRDGQDDLFSQLSSEVAPLIADNIEDEPQGEADEKIASEQVIPTLTWAGEKLKPQWTAQFLAGKVPYRMRPWLRARMPGFPARAELLAHAFPFDHGFPPIAPADMAADQELATLGRKLVGKDGGFSCTSCHGVGDMKPVGVFEAPGINLARVEQRLTKHYYDRWVYNPMRIVKETKMPAFADKEGKTSLTQTLDGDARKQYEAIYHYLLAGEKIQPPEN